MSTHGNPWSAVTPWFVDGKGEALVASRDLPRGTLLVRVAPFAAVPYGRFLHVVCSGCLQPCGDDESCVCSGCGVARHCVACASSRTGKAHRKHECFALSRLANHEFGLTIGHDDLRLLLRVLSLRKKWMDGADDADPGNRTGDDLPVADGHDTQGGSSCMTNDPATNAASEDSDLIVDTFSDFENLMSGAAGGDDGSLSDSALNTLTEVSKQCKFLVDSTCRASLDTYTSLLGRLQLNGFEITTAAEARVAWTCSVEGDDALNGAATKKKKGTPAPKATESKKPTGGHSPVGIGVYPSAASFNHDCNPNCAQRFDAHACVVVETVCFVKKGQELCIPYVDVNLDCEARNARLEKNFAFSCSCSRCSRERKR